MLLLGLLVTLAAAAPPSGRDDDLDFEEVVLGELHGCGRRADGTVACWGRNDRGQLGDGKFDDASYPRTVVDLTDVVGLEAGSFHTCAVRRDRTLVCWGDNQSGQLGAGNLDVHPFPVVVADLGPVLDVALGPTHSCAVTLDHGVSCWGNNLYGQLGMKGLRSVPRPVPIPGVPPMRAVAAGYGHTCAVGDDGIPWCWGDPSHGELGRPIGANTDPQPPAPIDTPFHDARALAARGTQTCALHPDGVSCWGAAPTDDVPMPAVLRKVEQKGLVALSLGWGHGCALVGGGEVTCWGDDRFGQLGSLHVVDGVTHGAYGLRDVTSIAAGNGETCAARGDGRRSVCWGSYTRDEKAAAVAEHPEIEVTPPPRRLRLPEGTELLVSAEEVLEHDGAVVRLNVHTVQQQPCANARIDVVTTIKKRKVTMALGDLFLPNGECIAAPARAVATTELHDDLLGRRDLVIRWHKKEDFYQLFLGLNKLEAIPLLETFSIWDGEKALERVPPGSMAISCVDHLEQPLCQRRLRDRLPACADLLTDDLVREAPALPDRRYASAWFMADPNAVRISPDRDYAAYRALFEQGWRDGSGCTDVRVRTWQGETWRNTHPLSP